MVILGWFKKKPKDENYEELLQSLAISISSRQTRLAELALRERRAKLWSTIYTLAGWAVYSFVWWLHLVPTIFQQRTRSNLEIERVVHLAPVITGPIIALLLRRIVQAWYHRKGAAEEKTLKELLTKQRTTIEELKRKTNYYSTRNLIERYDNVKPGSVPQTPQQNGSAGDPASQLRRRPRQSTRPDIPGGLQTPQQTPARPGEPTPQPQKPQFAATPPGPAKRQWFDKVADALLGVDDNSPGALDPSKSRYALICGRCSSHNGLVLESLWEDTQYVCPKCGFFNASPRSLRNRPTPSPTIDSQSRPLSAISPTTDASDDIRRGRLLPPDFNSSRGGDSPDSSPTRSRMSMSVSGSMTRDGSSTPEPPSLLVTEAGNGDAKADTSTDTTTMDVDE